MIILKTNKTTTTKKKQEKKDIMVPRREDWSNPQEVLTGSLMLQESLSELDGPRFLVSYSKNFKRITGMAKQ